MQSWIEISAGHLAGNFGAVQRAASGAEALCVLKADGYGHGAGICAPVLVRAGARWLGVADLEEGVAVRGALAGEAGAGEVRVVVMCGFASGDPFGLVEGGFTPAVWTAEHVRELEGAAGKLAREVAVHLEVDSGMARQGARPGAELGAVLGALGGCRWVRFEGVFSHLCCAEVAGSEETARQMGRFALALEQIGELPSVRRPEFVHFDNSSAVESGVTAGWMGLRAVNGSMRRLVRPGLALYGYTLPMVGAARSEMAVRPVATWKTRIAGLRGIAAGETVGYGATFRASEPMTLALLPVGYADGFRREASSGVGDGWVVIGGERAPVVGRVSMNLTVVDVTELAAEVGVGDEVVLLGEGVTAHDHARWAGTIPYEILCGMRGHRRLAD